VACSDLRQKEQLRVIDRLLTALDSLQKVTSDQFPDSINRMRMNMMHTETSLKNKLVLDTIDKSYAHDMDSYKKARKSIGKLNTYYVDLKAAMHKERHQLKTLRKDVRNGWGKRDRYDKYIQMEQENINVLSKRSSELLQKAVNIMDTYRLLHPKMVEILNNLEQ
jgi:tRNA U34 5-carboxymethylaminomethyl modifying enzyme MnmG/GidA